jgi:sialidase-1
MEMEFKIMNLFEDPKSNYTDYRIPAMVISDGGEIYVAFECRKDDSDWADMDIRILKSEDRGTTFTEIKRICGNGKTINNPVLIADGEIIHFLYCEEYWKVFHIVSTDGGAMWSEPKEITKIFDDLEHTVIATGPGHGIVTADGTLVVPVWLANNPEDLKSHHPSYLTTLYSKDHGETWNHGERLEEETLIEANETAIACLSDGSVLLNIRHCHPDIRARYFASSPNGYSDWSYLGLDKRFPDPKCMGSMCNGVGNLFFSNCESVDDRVNLVVKKSDDDFHTFTSVLVSEKAGYSEVAFWNDELYVLYETSEQKDGHRINHRLHLKKLSVK